VVGETEEVHLTYAELDRQARAIGARLQDLKMQGERALLLYPPGLEYIAAFFGALYAEAVAVPTYPPDVMRMERTLPRFLGIVNDARPAVVLTTASILAMIPYLLEGYPALKEIQWLATDEISSDVTAEWQRPDVRPDTLAFLQYTSGSTAEPKGVMLSHGNLMYNSAMIRAALGTSPDTRGMLWLPFYHDMGLIGGILQPIYCGATITLMSPLHFLQRPLRWLQAISRTRATHSGGPNFAYDLCVRKVTPEQRATLDLSCWKVAFNGAEPVRHQTLERFAETFAPCGFRREAFLPCYGLAEATLLVSGGSKGESTAHVSGHPVYYTVQTSALAQGRVTAASAGDRDAQTLVSSGHTWLDQKIVIVDPESLTMCPPERVGEIWVSGPNVAGGYWNQAPATERTFQARTADTGEGPFLRTGDLGFLKVEDPRHGVADPRQGKGELFVTGRLKDLIIVDGLNHYPQDIELTVEQSHPALRPGCSAAFSIEVNGEERLVVAAEVARADAIQRITIQGHGEERMGEAIIKAIRGAVSEQHDLRVHKVVLLKAGTIPKTSSGKIQRHACRVGFLAGTLDVWEG
jgi:acyl-CoA synthetase (AMP-forming)/AMP-acid ligase II